MIGWAPGRGRPKCPSERERCVCARRRAENGYDSRVIVAPIDRSALIERIDELLEARYRSADLFNLDDPLEEVVFILLSQQTREAVYRRVYGDLRGRFPRWQTPGRNRCELEAVLRPAGFQRRKALQLKQLLAAVVDANR